jgi:hypothetical protein
LDGLFIRWGAQILLQHPLAFGVLAQRRGALTGPGIQPHQEALRRFVQWIQSGPTSGVSDSLLVLSPITLAERQALQGASKALAQTFALKELPLIKAGAVRQGESSHEVALVHGRRLGQSGETVRAHLVRGVPVRPTFLQSILELIHVQPSIGVGLEPHVLPVDVQMTFA